MSVVAASGASDFESIGFGGSVSELATPKLGLLVWLGLLVVWVPWDWVYSVGLGGSGQGGVRRVCRGSRLRKGGGYTGTIVSDFGF